MAKAKTSSAPIFQKKAKKQGVASKSKTSKIKTSKLYKKPYRGQGK